MNAPPRDIIVPGGSAGGIEALHQVLRSLPATLPATLFVVLHRGPASGDTDSLAGVLRARTTLAVCAARDGQPLERGCVYVVPANVHLLLGNGVLHLERSPPESRFRPAINVLFKSAAATYGRRVVGVLPSGTLGGGRHGRALADQALRRRHDGARPRGCDLRRAAAPRRRPGAGKPHPAGAMDRPQALWTGLAGPARRRVRPAPGPHPDRGGRGHRGRQPPAESGRDGLRSPGLDRLRRRGARIARRESPDLVLMDIGVAGGMSGIETARRLWQTLQIPVVYCTAQADLQTLQAVQGIENYGYVVTPFHGEAVRAAIELAMARRERESRHAPRVDF